MADLKDRTIQGLFWSFIERIGFQLIQALLLIFMARILAPREFGLIGMLMVFTSIANIVIDGGFGSALIQKKEINNKDTSTVFYFNLAISILIYIILYALAPVIANFYHENELILLTRIVSLSVVINSFGLIQLNLYYRNLDFKSIAKASILAILTGGVVGITAALNGLGALSIVLLQVTQSIVKSFFLWLLSTWKPERTFSYHSLSRLFGFGSRLLFSSLLESVYQNIYALLIGRLYSSKDLGYYSQANQVQAIPVSTLSVIVNQVSFPAFSKVQDDLEKLKTGFRKSLKILVFVNFPMMLGLVAISKSLVLVVFTEKWLPAVPYLQLLALGGAILTLQTLNLNILKVKGRTDIYFNLEIIKKLIGITGIIIGIRYGISGLLIGLVITSYISYFLNAYFSGKLIEYGISEQLRDGLPYLISSLIMAALIYYTGIIIQSSDIIVLTSQLITALLSYIGICYLFKLEALTESLQILKYLRIYLAGENRR